MIISLRKNPRTMDMTAGPIAPLLLSFTLPLLLGNLFQLLYNTVDSIVVGNFVGTAALAAVGSTTQICNLLVKFFQGLSIGAGAVISQCYGAKDEARLHRAIQTTLTLTFLCCIGATLLGLSTSGWMLRRMGTPADVLGPATLYLRIYFSGVSALMLYNMGTAILRALGNSRYPLYFLILSSILNILLDLVFVVVFHLGIAGVAIATVIAQTVSAVLVLLVLMRQEGACAFRPRELQLDRTLTRRIFSVGLPIGLQSAVISFSNVFVQAYINAFGSACMAGWSCYAKLDQYMFLPIESMGQANVTFVGQNLGAHQCRRARQGTGTALRTTLLISAATAALLILFAPQATGLFSPDAEVIRYGSRFIRLSTAFGVLCSFNQVYAGALRGAGRSKIPMLVTISTHVIFRQIYLFVITRIIPGNVDVIAFGYPLGWIICACVMSLFFRFYRWDAEFAS